MKEKCNTYRVTNGAHIIGKRLEQPASKLTARMSKPIAQPKQKTKITASAKRARSVARIKATKVTARSKAVARRTSNRQKHPTPKSLAATLKKAALRRLHSEEEHRPTSLQSRARLCMRRQQSDAERRQAASLGHKALMRKKRIAARRPKRYTYVDCMRDEVPVPTGSNGTTIFQALMVGGMTAVTVTVGGVSSDGVGFLVNERWLYPVMFSISFLVRLYVGMPLIRLIDNRLIEGRLRGVLRNTVNVVLGTAVSSPITGAFVTLLFADADDVEGYALAYLDSLSATVPLSVLVSLFVIGPFAKLVFNNRIKPAGGLRAMKAISDHTASISRMLGF